jgi:hypothetical protein
MTSEERHNVINASSAAHVIFCNLERLFKSCSLDGTRGEKQQVVFLLLDMSHSNDWENDKIPGTTSPI